MHDLAKETLGVQSQWVSVEHFGVLQDGHSHNDHSPLYISKFFLRAMFRVDTKVEADLPPTPISFTIHILRTTVVLVDRQTIFGEAVDRV